VQLHSVATAAPNEGKWSGSYLDRFTPSERAPDTIDQRFRWAPVSGSTLWITETISYPYRKQNNVRRCSEYTNRVPRFIYIKYCT
jgi:hypothetical protein